MYAAILNKKLVLAIKEAEQVNKGFKKVKSRLLYLSVL
jgi:competence protein CoiA